MTTLLELQDEYNTPLSLESDDDKLWVYMDNENVMLTFNLTKEKARLLIESIQSYFKLDA